MVWHEERSQLVLNAPLDSGAEVHREKTGGCRSWPTNGLKACSGSLRFDPANLKAEQAVKFAELKDSNLKSAGLGNSGTSGAPGITAAKAARGSSSRTGLAGRAAASSSRVFGWLRACRTGLESGPTVRWGAIGRWPFQKWESAGMWRVGPDDPALPGVALGEEKRERLLNV